MNDHTQTFDDCDSTIGFDADSPHAPPEPPTVGERYRALRLVGEGGMGEVWEAEQLEPVKRRVALKVIKQGMDTRDVVARFSSERQTLALMEHPSIAKVLDAGVTDRGRPFFVMEFVDGQPISEFCSRHRLDTTGRLELFMEVCRGVHHAHQKAIIHRDLKPSNVLVTIQDDKPVPKIIDFGIAKAVEQPHTDHTMFTRHGQLIGTPAYMSPEQAEMSGRTIDTRTDIYSLGVVLYELLTGTLPFKLEELRQISFDEVRRRIREVDPPRPSTRISTQGERSSGAAQERRTTPARLTGALRGDLDWIVMKALEKEPERRYETANDLLLDVRRHLDNQPVLAGPPDAVYRVRKFVRRHRVMVAAGAAMLVAVVMGIAGTTVGLVRARAAEQQASREAEAANQISDFLVGLFKDSDPLRGQGDQVTTRQLLDKGYERIRERLVDRPDLQARLLHTLGSVYRSLGVRETAGESLESALQLRATLDGPDSLEYAETLHELGNLNRQRGDFDEAASMLEQALVIRKKRLGNVDPLVAATLNDLAIVHHDLNQYDRAEPLYREALDIYRSIPEVDDVSIGETLTSFGALLQLRGRLEEAEPLVREAIDRMRTAHGDDHPYVGFTIHNLSWLLRDLGDLEGAEAASRSALEVFERAFGDAHFTVANACNLLAQILREEGRFEEALVTGQRGFELSKAAFGEAHFATGDSAFNVGAILTDMERDAEARVYLLEALKINRTVFGDGSPETDTVLLGLGVVDESLGELELAEQRYREVVEIRRSADPPAPARLGCALSVLGNLENRTGRFAAAVTDLQAAWDLLQENEQYPRDCIVATEMRLGEALAGLGRYEEAEDHLLRAHEAYSGPPRRGYADEDWRENLDRSAERLHELYTAWGKPERARRYEKRRPGA